MKFRKPRFKDRYTDPDTKLEYAPENEPRARFGWGWRSVYIIGAVSLIIYIISLCSVSFSDFFNRYPAAFMRAVLAWITNILPFSLAECLLLLLIPACAAILIVACRWHCGSWRNVWCFAGKLLTVAVTLFSLFVWTFAAGYRGTTLDVKLGLDRDNVTADGLRETSEILVSKLNALSASVEYDSEDFSVMPYDRAEMNRLLLEAYDIVCDEYSFVQRLNSRVKPVMMSELMSYTHITGVYSYFTGEANINIVFPDYTIPYTAAHELAHQRGITREDEANFVAFLVCSASDDVYIQYSGYLNLLEYVLNAYYTADESEGHSEYRTLYSSLRANIRLEETAFSKFYDKYRKNVAASVSGAVNDTFLKANGTQGTVSYGLVAELAVAYYKNNSGK